MIPVLVILRPQFFYLPYQIQNTIIPTRYMHPLLMKYPAEYNPRLYSFFTALFLNMLTSFIYIASSCTGYSKLIVFPMKDNCMLATYVTSTTCRLCPGSLSKLDQLNSWIKNQLRKALLFTIHPLQVQNLMWERQTLLADTNFHNSRVSCQKGPICHA